MWDPRLGDTMLTLLYHGLESTELFSALWENKSSAAAWQQCSSCRGRKPPDLQQPGCISLTSGFIDPIKPYQTFLFPPAPVSFTSPLSNFCNTKTGAWQISHGEILIHRPIPHATWGVHNHTVARCFTRHRRGETILPAPAACFPSPAPPAMLQRPVLSHGPSVHICLLCTFSHSIHPLCQRNNSCVSLQLWRFPYWWISWLKSSSPLPVFKKRAIRREGLCLAG